MVSKIMQEASPEKYKQDQTKLERLKQKVKDNITHSRSMARTKQSPGCQRQVKEEEEEPAPQQGELILQKLKLQQWAVKLVEALIQSEEEE